MIVIKNNKLHEHRKNILPIFSTIIVLLQFLFIFEVTWKIVNCTKFICLSLRWLSLIFALMILIWYFIIHLFVNYSQQSPRRSDLLFLSWLKFIRTKKYCHGNNKCHLDTRCPFRNGNLSSRRSTTGCFVLWSFRLLPFQSFTTIKPRSLLKICQ